MVLLIVTSFQSLGLHRYQVVRTLCLARETCETQHTLTRKRLARSWMLWNKTPKISENDINVAAAQALGGVRSRSKPVDGGTWTRLPGIGQSRCHTENLHITNNLRTAAPETCTWASPIYPGRLRTRRILPTPSIHKMTWPKPSGGASFRAMNARLRLLSCENVPVCRAPRLSNLKHKHTSLRTRPNPYPPDQSG